MESKYTKGPWSIDIIEEEREIHICHPSEPIALATIFAEPLEEFDFANAKLIAAAPELLEALQDLITELSPSYNFDPSKYPDVMKKGLAAILKATSIKN